MPCVLSDEQIKQYHSDGLVFARQLFDDAQLQLLRTAMRDDPQIAAHLLLRPDTQGGNTRIALWNRAGDSVYGLAARCERVVDTAEALIGEPVYHFQSKLTAKEPFEGGAWEWHQDYGYWYYNGCLRADMLSVMVALDRCSRENGCLQIIRGSHRIGRLDHVRVTDKQNSADPPRVEHLLQSHEIVYCELDPGDAVIFHANALHRSDQNRSPSPRWTLIMCYNAITNDTFMRDDDRYYVPLQKVPDAAITAAGVRFSRNNQEHFAGQSFVPDTGHS